MTTADTSTARIYSVTAEAQAEQAERDPTNERTRALSARLPYGLTRATLDAVRDRAYGMHCAVSKRFLDALRRDTKLPKPSEATFDGDLATTALAPERTSTFDSGFSQPAEVELEDHVAQALARLEGECLGVAAIIAALRREYAKQPGPSSELVPLRAELARVDATAVERLNRFVYHDVPAMTRWSEEHGDTAPGWMDRAAVALAAERDGAS